MKKFRLRLVRSLIGVQETQRRTIAALGLRRIGQQIVVQDNPATRGQIFKVQHLLDVKPE